jgi:hypothetical protein
MATPLLITDRFTMVAPLGLRFHDTTTGTLVGDGLSIWAYPVGRPSAKRPAIANRKGVYVLHHGYGLRERENGDGSRAYWDNPDPPNKDFVIEITDEQRRFQPFQFTASIPVEGIFKWDGSLDSPPSTRTTVPLFSAPTRSVASGMAAIRADLWDTSLDAPAAWAVIEVFTAGKFLGRGIADDAGRIAVIFSYPTPLSFAPVSPPGSPLGSPPVATSPPLTEQLWPLELRAFYTPVRPVVSPPDFIEEVGPPLPDLRFTLSQPAAALWADADQAEILQETNMRFGRELILKSRPSPSSPPSPLSQTRDSVLFITPAVSPP